MKVDATENCRTPVMLHRELENPLCDLEDDQFVLSDSKQDQGTSGWQTCAVLDSVAQTKVGRKYQILAKDIAQTGEFPVIDQGQKFIAGYCDCKEKLIDFDLPLVIFGDHTRCFKYVDFPFVLGADGTKVLIPNKDLYDPKFFYFALVALELPSRGYNRHFKLLKERSLPRPQLPEQKKIAHILSSAQRAIEAQDRIIQTTTELKKALMHKLFTEGLHNEPQKQSEIGSIPQNWEVVRFSEYVSIRSGQVDPRQKPYDQMLHIGSENMESDTGRLENVQTNHDLRISSGNYYFTPEDVLYSKIRPHLNKVAMPDFEGTCSADIYPIQPREHFTREFLFYYLLSNTFKTAAVSFQDRTGIPKINRAQLGSIYLVHPPVEEQREIVGMLRVCDNRCSAAQCKKEVLQCLFHTLLHELITAKSRVEKFKPNLEEK